jgi:hypothetical protein
MQLPEGFNLEGPSQLCAFLQFTSTRFGWDFIHVSAAADKAQLARAIGICKMLLNPGNKDIAAAKFMNNECLYKRLCAQCILPKCIECTNYAVE